MAEAQTEVVSTVVERRSLAWGTQWASLWVIFNQAVKVVRGLIIPKLLEPATYGLWSSLSVIVGYAQYGDLGVNEQMAKRLPYWLGKDGEAGYQELATQGTGWGLVTASIVAIGLFLWSFVYQGPAPEFYRTALKLLAFIVIAQKFRYLGGTLLRAREEFRPLAIGGILVDGVGLVLAIMLLLAFGVMGLVWAFLATEVIVGIYYFSRTHLPRPRLALRSVLPLVTEGILLLGVAFSEQLMMTVDQLFLLRFFPREQYGIYALGLFVTTALLVASGIFLTVTQPRVMELSATGREAEAWRVVDSSLTLYLVFLALAIGLIVPAMDFMVNYYLPKYAPGMLAFVLMPGLAIVRGPVILLRPYFLSRNEERKVIGFQIAGLALAVTLDSLVVINHGGLPEIAMASILGYSLVTVAMATHFERDFAQVNKAKYCLLLSSMLGVFGLYFFYFIRQPDVGRAQYAMEGMKAAGVYLIAIGLVVFTFRGQWFKAIHVFQSPTQGRQPVSSAIEPVKPFGD